MVTNHGMFGFSNLSHSFATYVYAVCLGIIQEELAHIRRCDLFSITSRFSFIYHTCTFAAVYLHVD